MKIRWADGSEQEATDWVQMLKDTIAVQWSQMSKTEFKAEMAHRAAVWSETNLDQTQKAEGFFREMERAGLLVIL